MFCSRGFHRLKTPKPNYSHTSASPLVFSSSMFSSVQSLSRVQLFATPWTAAREASLSITNSRSLPKPMSIELVMPSNHLFLCCPFLSPVFPSIRVFSNESALHIRWPKYWSFSFNISPSNEHPWLISFRMDWLDLLAVQGTLKSLLQHHSSKASILRCSAFFIVQLSHPYMTTGKTITLTRRTFVDKVMSLLFNLLSRLVITFLPRSKRLLVSWLQSPSTVILEPRKIKSATVSPSICHEVMGPDAMILVFNIHLAISPEAQQSPNPSHSTHSNHPCTHFNFFSKPASIHHPVALAQDTKLHGAAKDAPRPPGPVQTLSLVLQILLRGLVLLGLS